MHVISETGEEICGEGLEVLLTGRPTGEILGTVESYASHESLLICTLSHLLEALILKLTFKKMLNGEEMGSL